MPINTSRRKGGGGGATPQSKNFAGGKAQEVGAKRMAPQVLKERANREGLQAVRAARGIREKDPYGGGVLPAFGEKQKDFVALLHREGNMDQVRAMSDREIYDDLGGQIGNAAATKIFYPRGMDDFNPALVQKGNEVRKAKLADLEIEKATLLADNSVEAAREVDQQIAYLQDEITDPVAAVGLLRDGILANTSISRSTEQALSHALADADALWQKVGTEAIPPEPPRSAIEFLNQPATELPEFMNLNKVPRWGVMAGGGVGAMALGAGGLDIAQHLMAQGQQQSNPVDYAAAVQAMNAYA